MEDKDIDAALAKVAKAPPHPAGLTEAEIKAAKDKARARIEAERKKAALARIEEEETQRLKLEDGLVTGDEAKDEMVNVTIDLPEYTGSITINMQPFWHGHTYTVPRHVAETLREVMQRGWAHQHEIEGKNLTQHYLQSRGTKMSMVSGATVNAPVAA